MSQPDPTPAPATAAIFGSTGLVGSHILSTLLATPSAAAAATSSSSIPATGSASFYPTIHTVSRRDPAAAKAVAAAISAREASSSSSSSSSSPATYPVLNPTVEPDTAAWPRALDTLTPSPTTVFSALGTTRAAAGSLAAQWKIDHDLNVELVKAAAASKSARARARIFVFVSSGGTDSRHAALSPYLRMKRGVQEALRTAATATAAADANADGAGGFQAVVLQPGLIMGERESSRGHGLMAGAAESAVRAVAGMFGRGWCDSFAQDAEVIARAAVAAARIAEQGKAPAKYWVVGAAEILRLGRDEWKEEKEGKRLTMGVATVE